MTKAEAKMVLTLYLNNRIRETPLTVIVQALDIMENDWHVTELSCECHNAFPVIHEKDCPNREVNKILAKREKDSC